MRRSLGFTLVEVLIVIGIMGVLAAILLVVVKPFEQLQKARDTQRRTDLRQIQQALEQYFQDNGHYPITTTGGPPYWSSEPGDYLDAQLDGGNHSPNYIPGLAPTYIKQLPRDPLGGNTTTPVCTALGLPNLKRAYTYISDGTSYLLMSRCGPEYLSTLNNSKDDLYSPSYGYRPSSSWQVCFGYGCQTNTW